MESADDLDASLDLARRFESAESFIAGGYNFGKVLVQAEGSDLLKEGAESGGSNGGAQSLYKGSVLLEGRIKCLANREEI
jgi:hypothetical protein